MQAPSWALADSTATLSDTFLRANVEPAQPALGMKVDASGATELQSARLFQIGRGGADWLSRNPLSESYVRGADLVATYDETAERRLRAQIYWRHLPATAPVLAGLDLVVSVQTSLLDESPTLNIATNIGHSDLLYLSAAAGEKFDRAILGATTTVTVNRKFARGCFVARPIGASWSYVEMVHPADFQRSEMELNADGARLTHPVFVQRLEKGVLLRARLRGLFVPRADDLSTAMDAYQEFEAADVPLTT